MVAMPNLRHGNMTIAQNARFGMVGMLCSLTMGCYFAPDMQNDVLQVLPSPDGKRQIVLFSRDGGATTGFNTQATLLEKGQALPNKGGNVFIIDQGDATVSWKDDDSVLVIFDHEARVFKKELSVSGVTFEYGQN